jgi:RNase P/RNase MRP subunit p29
MKLNPKFIIYHDWIGLEVYAKLKSKQNDEFHYIGIIIDDTENIIVSKKNHLIKKYIKKDHMFRIELPKQKKILEIDGEKIVGVPENRIRILKKKRRL